MSEADLLKVVLKRRNSYMQAKKALEKRVKSSSDFVEVEPRAMQPLGEPEPTNTHFHPGDRPSQRGEEPVLFQRTVSLTVSPRQAE